MALVPNATGAGGSEVSGKSTRDRTELMEV
jgi:hypothetical protein